MDFELTPEQQTLQNKAIEFARKELNNNMIERDAQQVFSRDGWQKCASFGVQGMPIPKEYGGSGADPITTIAMMEGLGYGGVDQFDPATQVRHRRAKEEISPRVVRWKSYRR